MRVKISYSTSTSRHTDIQMFCFVLFSYFSIWITKLSRPISIPQWIHHQRRFQCRPIDNIWMLPWICFGGPPCVNMPARDQQEVEPSLSSLWR